MFISIMEKYVNVKTFNCENVRIIKLKLHSFQLVSLIFVSTKPHLKYYLNIQPNKSNLSNDII